MDKVIDQQTILCGDALSRLRELPSQSVDLVVTDPPYNLSKDFGNGSDELAFSDYIRFSENWLAECDRVLKPTGTIYVFMGVKYISYIYQILEEKLGYTLNSWITWHYTQGIGKTRGFSPRHDDILMFTKDSRKFTFNLDDVRVPQKYYRSINNMRGANPGNVWEFSHVHYCNGNRCKHPTQKPEGLYERMILASSHAGETVLDPFGGSGTCLRVCQQTGRRGVSIEQNPDFCAMMEARLLEPFEGFDSIDERMKRCPNDLNDAQLRKDYVNNHVRWFLNNHSSEVTHFLHEVELKYSGKKEMPKQLEFLSDVDFPNNQDVG